MYSYLNIKMENYVHLFVFTTETFVLQNKDFA